MPTSVDSMGREGGMRETVTASPARTGAEGTTGPAAGCFLAAAPVFPVDFAFSALSALSDVATSYPPEKPAIDAASDRVLGTV